MPITGKSAQRNEENKYEACRLFVGDTLFLKTISMIVTLTVRGCCILPFFLHFTLHGDLTVVRHYCRGLDTLQAQQIADELMLVSGAQLDGQIPCRFIFAWQAKTNLKE